MFLFGVFLGVSGVLLFQNWDSVKETVMTFITSMPNPFNGDKKK